MQKRLLVNLFLLLAASAIVNAQTGTVKGVVLDKQSKGPVEFINVVLFSVKDSIFIKGELTDSAGAFTINTVTTGDYFLKLSLMGYQQTVTKNISITTDQPIVDVGQLFIGKDETQLKEVTITAEKPAFERKSDRTILNVSTSSTYKTATTALDVLKRAPGVRVDGEGGIQLRNNVVPMILIDGKVVPMNADELNTYLNTLGQDQIESIEIIDNPSAKYDATYKAIVDIKLKRDKNLGWKGTVSGFVLQNTYTGAGGSLNAGYRTKKMNVYGMYSYTKDKSNHLAHGKQYFQNDKQLLTLTGNEYRERDINSVQIGTDYFITPKQTVGVLLKGYNNQGKRKGDMLNELSTFPEGIILSNITTNDKQKRRFENFSVNANYDADFKKNHLSVNLLNAKYNSGMNQYLVNSIETSTIKQIQNLNSSIIDLSAAQVDYSHTFGKLIVEAGVKAAETKTDSKLQFDTLSVSNDWETDLTRTNHFLYKEDILAAYVSINASIGKKWNLQAGLRAENTKSLGNSLTTNTQVNRNYLKPLPSVTIAYVANDNNSVDLSYSLRLDRPSFDLLNPFRYYNGPYGYTEGNPFLLPVTSNSIGFNYTHKQLTTGVGYTLEKDKITQLAHVEKNIVGYTIVNFNDATFYNWSLSYPITITKWWSMQNTVALYYLHQKVLYDTTAFTIKYLTCYLEGSQVFSFSKGYTAEIRYSYYTKSKNDIYTSSDIYQLGIGFQKGFFHNKLNVKLNIEDVFYSQFATNSANIENYHAENYEKHDTRYVKLNLLYKFGRSAYERKSIRNSEEENRVR